MNASIKNPRKVAQEKTKSKLLTRAQMLAAMPSKEKAVIEGADAKTKGFLLDVLRLGEAGIIR